MSSPIVKTAEQLGYPEDSDEPSTEDIMDSIRQIISAEDEDNSALTDRSKYSHPAKPSNNNLVEADL